MLVFERDLGTSLLFFGVFVALLYVATERLSWLLIGLVLFLFGLVPRLVAVRPRPGSASTSGCTRSPTTNIDSDSYQLVQGLFGMGTGGLLGKGLGQGRPDIVPYAKTDFIVAAFGEELGLTGLMAILLALRHRRAARAAHRDRACATRSASCSPPAWRSAWRCRSSSSSAASPG